MSKLKIYGLIGQTLDHSFSPLYFKTKFNKEGIQDVDYKLFPIKNIQDFNALIDAEDLAGLNVTVPYKEAVIPYLDRLSNEAERIQAVNCVAFEGGQRIGYNTDVLGFYKSIMPLLENHHKQALILGTGGAAKAVRFVLDKLEIPYVSVSRQPVALELSYEEAEAKLHRYPLIINTTPVGTYPNIDDCPLRTTQGIGKQHLVYDLIYNPNPSRLLQLAHAQGAKVKNGLEMLEIQAEESWKIWTR